MDNTPDYSSYSYNDLVDAYNHVNMEAFPERYEELKNRIEQFNSSDSDQSEEKLTKSTGTENRLEFTGQAGEFFSIWIVNTLLTIVTLGIYSAWAKVRSQTYFYGNTFLDGASFRYHAKPLQILKGRIIAFILFMAYYFSGYVNLKVAGITFVTIALLMPSFIVMSLAFRMKNSSYRSVRFNFDKNYKKAYMIFSVPFILLAAYFYQVIDLQQNMDMDLEISDFNFMQFMLLPILISCLYPLFEYFLVKFRVNHSSFGMSRFEFNSGAGSFYYIYFVAGLAFILGVILFSFTVGIITSFLNSATANSAEGPPEYFIYILMIPMMALYLCVFAYIQTKRTNLIYSETQIQRHQLQSNLQVGHMAYLYFTNTIAIALSLGLMTPWAMVRTSRYRASCTSVTSQDSLDKFVANQSNEQSAYGEEIGDMFDMDLGF